MIVKGLINLLAKTLCGAKSPVLTFAGGRTDSTYGIVINDDSITYTTALSLATSTVGNVWYPLSYTIRLGQGTTPPTVEDTNIETGSTSSISGTVSRFGPKVVVTGSFTNSSTDAISYSEIGLFRVGTFNYGVLLTRSLFSEPVTIPAGESKSFTITLDLSKLADSVAVS